MESCIAWDSKYDPLSMKFRLVYMELFAWEGEICHERFVNRSFGGSTWNHVYGDNRLGTCYRKWKTIHFNSIWFKLWCTVRPYTAPWKIRLYLHFGWKYFLLKFNEVQKKRIYLFNWKYCLYVSLLYWFTRV